MKSLARCPHIPVSLTLFISALLLWLCLLLALSPSTLGQTVPSPIEAIQAVEMPGGVEVTIQADGKISRENLVEIRTSEARDTLIFLLNGLTMERRHLVTVPPGLILAVVAEMEDELVKLSVDLVDPVPFDVIETEAGLSILIGDVEAVRTSVLKRTARSPIEAIQVVEMPGGVEVTIQADGKISRENLVEIRTSEARDTLIFLLNGLTMERRHLVTVPPGLILAVVAEMEDELVKLSVDLVDPVPFDVVETEAGLSILIGDVEAVAEERERIRREQTRQAIAELKEARTTPQQTQITETETALQEIETPETPTTLHETQNALGDNHEEVISTAILTVATVESSEIIRTSAQEQTASSPIVAIQVVKVPRKVAITIQADGKISRENLVEIRTSEARDTLIFLLNGLTVARRHVVAVTRGSILALAAEMENGLVKLSVDLVGPVPFDVIETETGELSILIDDAEAIAEERERIRRERARQAIALAETEVDLASASLKQARANGLADDPFAEATAKIGEAQDTLQKARNAFARGDYEETIGAAILTAVSAQSSFKIARTVLTTPVPVPIVELPIPPEPGPEPELIPEETILEIVEFTDIPLHQVISTLSRATRKNIIIDDVIRDILITLSLQNVTFQEMLESIRSTHEQVDFIERTDGFFISTPERILSLQTQPQPQPEPIPEETILETVEFTDIPLHQVISTLSRATRKNIIIDDVIRDILITLSLQNVTFQEVLESIRSTHEQVDFIERTDEFFISTPERILSLQPQPQPIVVPQPEPGPEPTPDETILETVELSDMPLHQAIRTLGRVTQKNVIIDTAVQNIPITISLRNVTFREILRNIAFIYESIDFIERSDGFFISTPEKIEDLRGGVADPLSQVHVFDLRGFQPTQVRSILIFYIPELTEKHVGVIGDQLLVRGTPETLVRVDALIEDLQRRAGQPTEEGGTPFSLKVDAGGISANLREADLVSVLNQIAQQSDQNVAIAPEVNGTTTANFKDLNFEEALEILLFATDFQFVKLNTTYIIASSQYIQGLSLEPARGAEEEGGEEKVLRRFPLTHISPEDARALLATFVTLETAAIDARTNALLIRDTPSKLEQVEEILKSIDLPSEQSVGPEVMELIPTEPGSKLDIEIDTSVDPMLVSVKLNDAELSQVLAILVQESGINIFFDQQCSGTVTADFEVIPFDVALDLILKPSGCSFTTQTSSEPTYIISSETRIKEVFQERATQKFPVDFADAEALASVLGSAFSDASLTVVQAGTGLLVRATPDELEEIGQLIVDLDTKLPEVMIQAQMVDLSRNASRQLGLNFTGTDTGAGDDPVFLGEDPAGAGGLIDIGLQFDFAAGVWGLTTTIDRLTSALRALEQQDEASVLSSPRVATISGQQAIIVSGQTIFFKIREETDSGITERFESIEVGIQLTITPIVNPSGFITVELTVTESQPIGAIPAESTQPPNTQTRTINTTIRVRDGETIVIGGLLQNFSEETLNKVPLLGDIPVLGELFKSRSTSQQERELTIFITPRILNS
ncbi:MAG: secretin N-terminal domain-containing protein [Candidatus Bipolaricaulia bacterium]